MKKTILILLTVVVVFPAAAQDKALEAYISEAWALSKEGKLDDAIALMKKGVEAYPDSPDAHLQFGLLKGELGRTTMNLDAINGAFAALDKALDIDPDHLDTHYYYGIWGVNVPPFFNRFNAGVEHLEKALKLLDSGLHENVHEMKVAIYNGLGQGYFLQKEFIKAREAYTAVTYMAPEGEAAEAAKKGLAAIDKAMAEAPQLKTQDAKESLKVEALRKKLKSDPGNFDLLMALGRAYFEEEKYGKATAVMHQAVEADPQSAEAQFFLGQVISADAGLEYDERVYEDQSTRTNLAFASAASLEKAYEMAPDNDEIKLHFAVSTVQMPYFVGRIDKGLKLLQELVDDADADESLRIEASYWLGFGLRKKGNAVWMKMIKTYPKAEQIASVFDEFGLREHANPAPDGEHVAVTFHVGFMDELAPQTAVWVEDAMGNFVKTLYVSGFSAFAKEKQVNLFDWSKKSKFETDGTTGASIDWGKHTYFWDLTGQDSKRVRDGAYKIQVEVAWWPSMKYGRAGALIEIGKKPKHVKSGKKPWVPLLEVTYVK